MRTNDNWPGRSYSGGGLRNTTSRTVSVIAPMPMASDTIATSAATEYLATARAVAHVVRLIQLLAPVGLTHVVSALLRARTSTQFVSARV